jgi:hypothetical protein
MTVGAVSILGVQDFIENYHEKSKEDFLFPRFRKAHQVVDLVTTLLERHQAPHRTQAQDADRQARQPS